MESLDALIVALATWRLTSIIHREGIARFVRRLAGGKWDSTLEVTEYPDNFVGELFSCFWCLSVWVALLCTLTYFIFPPVLYILAASTVAILIERLV
jgi:hypothetical protein